VLKVMTIVGTRPELIKMSRVIAELDKYTKHVLVHTGQNHDYELNQVFFDELEIRKPDYFLSAAGRNAAQTIAQVISKVDETLEAEAPQAVLLYGDTNSCLSIIAAKRRQIPVFHMEAGNRCFDQRVPEELNRKVLDHLADINLVLTEHARRYLIAEGIRPETIIKTGSHMREVLDYHLPRIRRSDVLRRLGLESERYFLASIHREENVDSAESLEQLLACLDALVEAYSLPVMVSTHPRTRRRLAERGQGNVRKEITFHPPFGFLDYVHLQMHALCVLSDSGTITEETALLNLRSVIVRNTHERPEGMDAGTLIMSGLRKERIVDTVKTIVAQWSPDGPAVLPVDDYENPHVSAQIVRIVSSYVDYVNRTVWSK